ncbi:DnaJ-like protein subfamily C member 13 [Phytophthora ramorum]|uniref:DnaJ-like protein subfamily C member 13 n=1 Tax=Phytophthora ramorum TaxID=164328 RepID=UPI0030A02EF3|nr:DnaJ-like protein subfamily C member 13 [Phytophthora ramorum]
MSNTLFGRAAAEASSGSNGNSSGPTVSLPDAESRRRLLPRDGRSQRSTTASNVSFLGATPIEEFVAKYQVIKVSWRGKYERIVALAPTRFCTIDPRDFEVTNTWSLTALRSISLDATDNQGFALTLKGAKKDEQLKLRCRFRSRLLSDLYRLKEQYQQRNVHPDTGFQCSKWSRKGEMLSCTLDVGMDGVTITQPGIVRSKYLYTEMEHVTLLLDSQDGFAVGYTGRSRLLFSQQRGQIYHRIQAAAEAIGCKITARPNVTVEKVQEERGYYGLNSGEPFVQFHARKLTPKYSEPQERILSLHEKVLVELDRDEKVIACYNYSDIYVLVREPTNAEQFEIQFRNDQVRTYMAKDRDGVLSAIYDICATCEENPEVFISGVVNQRGLRLLPFSAVEDTAETQSFFNDPSIGSWYLQRMASVGKFGNSLKIGDRSFIEIVAEFNANVPASGIPYNTKHSIIGDALRPVCAQLYYVAKTKPVPERSAVTLIQALFRISSSYYGFHEIGQAGQISETITNLLINGEEFVVFWTTLLLRKVTAHTAPSSANLDKPSLRYCEEVETQNKKIFLGNTYLTQSLMTHLEDIDMEPNSKNTNERPRAGPLVMMGLLQTLEGCLCSRASTTGAVEFTTLVEGVAKFYSTLLKVLFQSRCATTVEACTLLLKTTLEECDPVVASSIRDKALTEGIVLRHFYQGLFDESFDQRCVSRYLVSLWMSHHDGSKQLLSRMIPAGFFHLLKEPPGTPAQIEGYDRLEREAMEEERQERSLEYTDDDRTSSTSESTFQGDSIMGVVAAAHAGYVNAVDFEEVQCQAHLQDFAEALEEDAAREWCFCWMAPVAFKELAEELWCGGVYLGQFCEHENFAILDPLDFMEKLTMEWRAEISRQDVSLNSTQAQQMLGLTVEESSQIPDATLRAGFKEKARSLLQSNIPADEYNERLSELREAYQILTCPRPTLLTIGHDPENLLLLLHSLVIMCNRYPEQLSNYEFDAYDLLLPLLDAHCTAQGTPPQGTTKAQTLEISVCAAELIYNTCAVSLTNGDLLLEQPSLNTLEKVVNFCVDSMVGCEAAENPKLLEVCFFLLQTITGLLASPRGRDWIAESPTLVVDMVRVLWLWNHAAKKSFLLSKITQQVLEGVSRMAQLEKNQQRLAKAGVLWQLFLLFSIYEVDLDDTTVHTRLQESLGSEEEGFATVAVEVQNLLAIMAVRALCKLGGFFAEGSELQSPANSLVKQVVDALMTPNLSGLLLVSSHHEFLKIFHGECESYTLFWNSAMRLEQMDFVSPRANIEPAVQMDEHYTAAIQFRFMYLADLFYVGGLYIEMLMGSLLVIEKSLVPAPVSQLGLTEAFFKELFSFIDSGKLICPEFVNEEGAVQTLPPYAGWDVTEEQRTTMDRVTALNCLSIATSVAPALVEKNLVANDSAMKMVLRLLFPPDNEVHQSEDAEKSLVLTPQLYVPCRLHCIATLQVLSTLECFGTASMEYGICDILIELIHICQDVGPDILRIIRNLCANGAAAKCISEILQSGVYLEFIGWVLLVEETIVDDEFDAAERLRIPSALVLSEMVKDGGPLNIESRRALCRFFPPAIVRTVASSPDTIVEYIMADHMTPELVWNVEFRNHQRNNVVNFLNIYFSSTSTTETEDGNFTSVVDSFEIDYTGLYPAPIAGNVYLTLFMEDPTFNLHDPLYFMTCLWSEFEVLFKQLAHMTSALRATMAQADDELIQHDIDLVDLVGSSLVCLLQVETSLLDKVAELQIPAKCCDYLNDTVRSQACEPCVVNVVRILRVCTMSRACIISMQPMCSTALSCLMAITNPMRGGPLHLEGAFVLEIMRRLVLEYPEHGDRDASTGIVYLASRLDLFGFLLNILENPDGIGRMKEPHIVRAEAIEILNMLEKDRVQGSTAHQILKKHKKWQKSYRHEATDVVMSMSNEDPFLKPLFPEADRVMREYVRMNPRHSVV